MHLPEEQISALDGDYSDSQDRDGESGASAQGTLSSRDKANFILRRLEKYGWISMETDHSYVQRVNFRDYAVKVIKTLLDIAEDKKTYLRFAAYGKALTEHDRRELQRMKEEPFFAGQRELFELILERGRKVEQECVVEIGK